MTKAIVIEADRGLRDALATALSFIVASPPIALATADHALTIPTTAADVILTAVRPTTVRPPHNHAEDIALLRSHTDATIVAYGATDSALAQAIRNGANTVLQTPFGLYDLRTALHPFTANQAA